MTTAEEIIKTTARTRWIEHLVVMAAYLFVTLLMTYPVALSMTRSIPIDHQIKGWYPGDGDPWHFLWAVWYFKRGLGAFPPHLFWTDLVFYPIGLELPFITGIGALLLVAAPLASLLGLVLTYNVLWLLSFALTGHAMYLLGRYLFRDRLVAFFCGHVFMFSSYRLAHALEHIPLLVASCLVPLFALCLFKAVEDPTTKRWVLCAVVLAASAGTWWYGTVSLLLYLAVFGLVSIRRRWRHIRPRHLRPIAVALGVLVALASPLVLPMILSPARDTIVTRPLSETIWFSADLLAFFVPSSRHPVFGPFVGSIYQRFTGNAYEQTVYLGAILLVLAIIGVAGGVREKVRLFAVVAGTFFVLALGPFLHVYGRYQFTLDGGVVRIPLPHLLFHYIPVLNGVRVPSRFTEMLVFSLVILAGYGLSAMCARLETPRWRAGLVGVLLVGVAIESAAAPFPVLGAEVPPVYASIGTSREPFMVLELPLDWRVIKYHYYQTVHGKRLLVGHPVRTREKYIAYPGNLPLIPLLAEPGLLLGRPAPADARRDAERLVTFFDIRHVVIHRRYLDPAVFEALDRFVGDYFPHVRRTADGEVVAYALAAPDGRGAQWPEDYLIDFGGPDRAFAVLTGWGDDEQWGAITLQWSTDRESSMYLYLPELADRVLAMRLLPLAYEGAPRQTVAVYVNGALQDRLPLEAGWASYELRLPAGAFRRGLNALRFEYGYAVSPARVIPGNGDRRVLAVAFDSVALRRAR